MMEQSGQGTTHVPGGVEAASDVDRGAEAALAALTRALARLLGAPVDLAITAVVDAERRWLAGTPEAGFRLLAWSDPGTTAPPTERAATYADGAVVRVTARTAAPVPWTAAQPWLDATAAAVGATVLQGRLIRRLAEEVGDLTAAMRSRTVIDQAIGVVMAQNRCEPGQAFDVLRRASQNRNRRLADVAEHVVLQVAGARPGARPWTRRPDGR
ncbi:ANTAR domain-containing protein [Cellulomonas sp. Y8]|uniref:ANTAR domain-containing protein n=1 Tax=Cellulomonas sp. Y8 TaxID=2591145 RepID=UPI003D7025B5